MSKLVEEKKEALWESRSEKVFLRPVLIERCIQGLYTSDWQKGPFFDYFSSWSTREIVEKGPV
jgi:hypothetical protein